MSANTGESLFGNGNLHLRQDGQHALPRAGRFTDHLGTPLLQTDCTKAVVWRAEHEPYGRIHAMRAGTSSHQPLRLPGQEAEQVSSNPDNGQTERSYNIFRWYRGGWGRYSQADPIDYEHGLNLYSYAHNNPIVLRDPDGRAVRTFGCSPEEKARIKRAAEDADAASETCIPCPDRKPFRRKVRNLGVHCVGSETDPGTGEAVCGRAGYGGSSGRWILYHHTIAVTRDGLDGTGGCTCLKAIILHEVGHLIGYGHAAPRDAYGLEERCFKCYPTFTMELDVTN